MKQLDAAILILIMVFLIGCSSAKHVSLDELQNGKAKSNSVCVVTTLWDLKGQTVALPKNSILVFKNGGCIQNGTLAGNNTKIVYKVPFVGNTVTIKGCSIIGKFVVVDKEVFLNVQHTQKEIQTLFDISGGKKIKFSKGEYQDVEKIIINNNIEADFSNSTINLRIGKDYVAECFYMEPWVNSHVDFFKINNLTIKGKCNGINGTVSRRCIQLFYVSNVVLDNVSIDKFYGGPEEYKSGDLLDKSRIGTSAIAIMNYDKCVINNCSTNDISKEIFWCVPNTNPRNITYFTNNKSTCSSTNGSSSFFTILDGRCEVRGNEVYNYNGSAINAFCYDSEISDNKFYDGKRSIAIDLSEGTMYRAKNVSIHDNFCYNTKGMVSAFGEDITIKNNHWSNNTKQKGDRIYIVDILTRGKREKDGKYIGCSNNPEIVSGSNNIFIQDNICKNTGGVIDNEIRFAILKGDDITVKHNLLVGFNVPVVQLVDGDAFEYTKNVITESKRSYYAELLINRGKDIKITKNTFCQNNTAENNNCTVQVLSAEGQLTFKANTINTEAPEFVKTRTYIPCLINDYSRLEKVDYYVKGIGENIEVETGLNTDIIKIRTNVGN